MEYFAQSILRPCISTTAQPCLPLPAMDVAAPPSRDASNGSFSFLKLPSWLAAAGRCMENDPDLFAGGAGMSRYVCLLTGGGQYFC